MARTRYFFDKKELVYKEMRLSFVQRLSRFLLIFIFSLILAAAYGIGFKHFFGSPKENRLQSELDEISFKYSLLEKDFEHIGRELSEVASVEDNVYRPVFSMEQIPSSFRQSGFGGTRKYSMLEGYENSDLMISATRSVDELLRKVYIQSRSFEDIIPVASVWKDSIAHIPFVRPVNVNIPLGDGLKFREKHPVLGSPKWHYGQDFTAPSGTEVFATGAGVVSRAGWSPYGFGNMVEVDHGYGFNTIYGHLSAVKVSRGQEVKRGELLGLSGSTGISSGPHLHYEIHYNGRVQNPLYFFDDDLTMEEYNRMIDTFHKSSVN
ncbi:MAG: M23 family metallopeptidase [Bacteroidales bacterium]|nr:M23 family metallopeptidase [Bacteroidales bacterium]